jgi:hypothetical protein
MRQFTEDEMIQVNDLIKGVKALDDKIEESKEIQKNYNSSRKEMFKNLAEKMECGVNGLKSAYKDYIASIEENEEYKEKEDILSFFLTFVKKGK